MYMDDDGSNDFNATGDAGACSAACFALLIIITFFIRFVEVGAIDRLPLVYIRRKNYSITAVPVSEQSGSRRMSDSFIK